MEKRNRFAILGVAASIVGVLAISAATQTRRIGKPAERSRPSPTRPHDEGWRTRS